MKISFSDCPKKINEFENKLRIQTTITSNDTENDSPLNHIYEVTAYSFLEYLFDRYPFAPEDHLVDFGCGKGRVLIMAAEYGCLNLTGYEINKERCIILKKNIESYAQTKKPARFHILNMNAEKATIYPDQNIFYFFEPFHLKIFIRVFRLIQDSIRLHPRKIKIMMHYPHPETIKYVQQHTGFSMTDRIQDEKFDVLTLLAIFENK